MYDVISFPLIGLEMNLPRSFSLFGFEIYYYGLIIAAGFILAAVYAYKRCRAFGLVPDRILDMLLIVIIAGIVGARIYYVIFNAKDYFTSGNLIQIFNIRNGGLAVYGGIIAGAASVAVYCKRKKLNILKTLDVAGIALPLGQAIGRWGNLINREAHGYETTVPWKMGLTDGYGTTYVHPAFLYESLWNLLGFILLHIYSKKAKKRVNGELILLYTAWYGFGRFFIESLRTDSLMIGSMRVSQAVAAVTFAAAVALIVYLKRNAKSGLSGDPVSLELIEEIGPAEDFDPEETSILEGPYVPEENDDHDEPDEQEEPLKTDDDSGLDETIESDEDSENS